MAHRTRRSGLAAVGAYVLLGLVVALVGMLLGQLVALLLYWLEYGDLDWAVTLLAHPSTGNRVAEMLGVAVVLALYVPWAKRQYRSDRGKRLTHTPGHEEEQDAKLAARASRQMKEAAPERNDAAADMPEQTARRRD